MVSDEYFMVEVNVIDGAFSWESQARQYAEFGPPGISLESHYLDMASDREVYPLGADLTDPNVTCINCLLHRDSDGRLDGILNHYDGKNPLERKDAINLWVRPDSQRRGIGTALVREAVGRWPGIDYRELRYTQDGLGLLKRFIESGEIAP